MSRYVLILNDLANSIINSTYDDFPSDFKNLLEESIELYLRNYYSEFMDFEMEIDENSESGDTDESISSNTTNLSNDDFDYLEQDVKILSYQFGIFYANYVKSYLNNRTTKLDYIQDKKNRSIMIILLFLEKSNDPITTFFSCF